MPLGQGSRAVYYHPGLKDTTKEHLMKEEQTHTLAVFIDFENLALGLKDHRDRFDIHRVLDRLLEKGNIVVKRAYADWSRFGGYSHNLHESAIELIEVPARRLTGKNSADMRLTVDAMDLAHSKPHIDMFVILSGDSDFSPLVSKLRENNKLVIGMGMRDATSVLLRDNCDEFIFYEDLKAETAVMAQTHQNQPPRDAGDKRKDAMKLLIEALEALRRENRETLWSSLIKTTMKRKQPSFSEVACGFRNFSQLLEEAQKAGLVKLGRDETDRTYIVTSFGAERPVSEPAPVSAPAVPVEPGVAAQPEAAAAPAAKPARRRRPRSRSRRPRRPVSPAAKPAV
jgi:uncharacterized protein (TIGR00288 family)